MCVCMCLLMLEEEDERLDSLLVLSKGLPGKGWELICISGCLSVCAAPAVRELPPSEPSGPHRRS